MKEQLYHHLKRKVDLSDCQDQLLKVCCGLERHPDLCK